MCLAEYQRYKNYCFEIQVRSSLQHAWAEIEHELGYKSKNALPRHVQRSFSRQAGLLEFADEEFIRIRNELKQYDQKLEQDVVENSESVAIDLASISKFFQKDSLVQDISQSIAIER